MKQLRTRALALLLTLGMLCSLCPSALALDIAGHWWQKYVDAPMEDYSIAGITDGHVTAQGPYVLVTSDVHRYAYLVADLLETANEAIAQDGADGNVGLMAFGGDFANEYVLYNDNMSIIKAALESSPGTVATYTKGNHEGSVTDEEFIKLTGMSRIGETAVNEDGLYHFFNFGALDKNQQFTDEDIAQLKAYLESIPDDDHKSIVIVSHYPLHYYNDRRSSKQADKVLALLNNYPQAIFLWGHNHTEQDPNYGMIRMPGDIIQTGASADTTREIEFTYACLGALRDGINGANGLLMRFDEDGTTTFRYVSLNAKPDAEDAWTDAQGNENPVRYPSNEGISTTTTAATPTEESFQTIRLANIQIQRPLVDAEPAAAASEYSDRFHAGEIAWTAGGRAVSGSFDFDTAYTASVTLTAEAGYTFAQDAAVSVNKQYVGPMDGQENNLAQVTVAADGTSANVTYTFPATAAQSSTPADVATKLADGVSYVLATTSAYNTAASYLYDPAQHGEESMPDYAVAAADAVIRDGKLISAPQPATVFTAQRDGDGYLLWSDASLLDGQGATTLNYLTMSTRGGDLGIQAAEAPDMEIYTDWNVDENGLPYLNVDGAIRYPVYNGSTFGFTASADDCNMRLYQVGTSNQVYNVAVAVAAPEPGHTPATLDEIGDIYGGYTVTDLKWDTEGAFGYGASYTVTATVAAKSGYAFAKPYVGRISGKDAEVTDNGDGTLTLRYTFAPTSEKPALSSGLAAKAVTALENGKQYVIVSGSSAMSGITSQGIYLSAEDVTISGDTITAGLTRDMMFTAVGNDADGYALEQDGRYLAGCSVNGTPDLWGFTTTEKSSAALTWSFAEDTLTVVSTGASGGPGAPPPPPPSAAANALYYNNGHFNFSTLTSSKIQIFEVYLPFTDVEADRWSYDTIYQAAENGIVHGVAPTLFAPETELSRAMAVTMLYRMAGCPEVTGVVQFRDVKKDYYTDALVWAVQNEIVLGLPDGTFAPDENITREDACAMAARFMRLMEIDGSGDGQTVTFTDAALIADYAKDDVALCAGAGVIKGYPDGTFQPKGQITRQEATAIFMRVYNKMS